MYQKRKNNWLNEIKNGPYITYLFLAIQVIVFVLMELMGIFTGSLNGSQDSGILLTFGAMTSQAVTEFHQYWRFITPIFVHIGFVHIGINSLTLYFVGRILEPIIGHWRFFALYMISGITGNLLSFAFSNPFSISAGASTALFGMFGAFIILGQMYPSHFLISSMYRNMKLLIIMNLVLNLFDSNVDIFGHLGGVIGGIAMMLILGVPNNRRGMENKINPHFRILAFVLLIFLLVFCLIYGFRFN
ncbi:rhomboid family intramembrane serine protease [Vagococcus sp.]|uniref:rhomboid family intramembrane serine protease n=1 Tax=Vagococcus sp. TaxID=1933889 RepID=UPI003F986605